MISILTLTYQRHKILEEAVQSYLLQPDLKNTEMVIINDHPSVKYNCSHENIRIINCDKRFSSIGKKLEYGFSQCNGDFIFRLDDDDLLSPWGLELTRDYIKENPGYDVYRSKHHYFFSNNSYLKTCANVNNGNVYTKSAVSRIKFPDLSFGEDVNITYNQGFKICEVDKKRYAMIYRWGSINNNFTYHVSGMGNISPSEALERTDKEIKVFEEGNIMLEPKFNSDYYRQLPTV